MEQPPVVWGALGVFAAISISNVLGAICAGRVLNRALKASGSDLAEARPIDDYLADWNAIANKIRSKSH